MFEHTSFTYDMIVAEQERVDRANEMRRIVSENPSRIVRRERPFVAWMRRLGARRETVDARERASRPAHAR